MDVTKIFRSSHAALRCFVQRDAIPGYRELAFWERQRINRQAFVRFICSANAIRLALWLGAWWLAALIVSWRYDLGIRATAALQLGAIVWVGPWLAHARQRHLAEILGARWTQHS